MTSNIANRFATRVRWRPATPLNALVDFVPDRSPSFLESAHGSLDETKNHVHAGHPKPYLATTRKKNPTSCSLALLGRRDYIAPIPPRARIRSLLTAIMPMPMISTAVPSSPPSGPKLPPVKRKGPGVCT